jgi:hypothetical protein
MPEVSCRQRVADGFAYRPVALVSLARPEVQLGDPPVVSAVQKLT